MHVRMHQIMLRSPKSQWLLTQHNDTAQLYIFHLLCVLHGSKGLCSLQRVRDRGGEMLHLYACFHNHQGKSKRGILSVTYWLLKLPHGKNIWNFYSHFTGLSESHRRGKYNPSVCWEREEKRNRSWYLPQLFCATKNWVQSPFYVQITFSPTPRKTTPNPCEVMT